MTDSSLVDHMTRIKLKLLEKKLENERKNTEDNFEKSLTTAKSYDGHEEALQSALRRRKDLLQRLREQHFLEELSRPHTWDGSYQRSCILEPLQQALPRHAYHLPLTPAPVDPPKIIQQQIPQQPATIIQQLPPQQPLITQIPPPQPLPPIRSGSIKEDMVEMMLMQNAQMHQIIMQNMMLKALPPMAFSHSSNANIHAFQHAQQDSQFVAPVMLKPERNKSSSVHHHHHYMPPSGVPPASNPLPSLTGYSMWPPAMPSNIMGQGLPHTVHHITGPTTMMPTQHTSGWNPSQNAHWTIN
uniref:Uncharacterized protein C21orf58 homolog isoform X2 n=1 Tax=Geotrypetes seraphini TaxID=260995 RepID=A0A6P8RJ09_GEOSA|nr:uncharacterized protein C21orf58 homolog isoform X2 [Geotrypetes seraphini]XP_033802947.1 uncharacterized protein C21orf58 homolog isoform X2 [Geotrypetes seraphini]